MLAAAMFFNKRMQAQFRSQRQQLGEINAQVEDSLLGVRVVKSFANEPLEEKKFEEGNQRFYNIKRLRYMYMAALKPPINSLTVSCISWSSLRAPSS